MSLSTVCLDIAHENYESVNYISGLGFDGCLCSGGSGKENSNLLNSEVGLVDYILIDIISKDKKITKGVEWSLV